MSNRVLPALLILLEIRKSLGNVIVYLAERRALVRRILRDGREIIKVEKNVVKYQTAINLNVLSSPQDFHIFLAPDKSSKHAKLLSAPIDQAPS